MSSKNVHQGHVNINRRRAVLGTATGAAAAVWHKPIINAIAIPAHAQTSVAAVTTVAPTTASFFGASVTAGGIVNNSSPLDFLIAPAMAGGNVYTVSATQTDTEGKVFDIGVFEEFPYGGQEGIETVQVVYGDSVTMGETKILSVRENPCEVRLKDFNVEIVEVNADSIVLNFPIREESVTVLEGNDTLPTAECVMAVTYFGERVLPEGMGLQGRRTEDGMPSILDVIIPSAIAGNNINSEIGIFARRESGNNYFVQVLSNTENLLSSGMLTVGGSGMTLGTTNGCVQVTEPPIAAQILSVNSSTMTIEVENSDDETTFTYVIDLGFGTLELGCE